MDTRLIIWWSGIAEPTGPSKLPVDFNRLKIRLSVLAGYSDETSASVLGPAVNHLNSDLHHVCVKTRIVEKTC